MLNIVADENIPLLTETFGEISCLTLLPGREISASSLVGTDVLLVRSVTKVNEELLAGSRIRFVGTATSGLEHIDQTYLSEQGIAFAHAQGANANSVVDYVFAVLSTLNSEAGFNWLSKSVGLIGGGHVGSLLWQKLSALGVAVKVYDPFLTSDSTLAGALSSFDDVMSCDVISIHAPLTSGVAFPTKAMINHEVLNQLGRHQVLINAARGGIVCERDLLSERSAFKGTLVIDTWESEPCINRALFSKAYLGSAHIAGYSAEGKRKGLKMIYEACCKYFNIDADLTDKSDSSKKIIFKLTETSAEFCALLSEKIINTYPVRNEHTLLKTVLASDSPSEGFDALRKNYGARHEFSSSLMSNESDSEAFMAAMNILGFSE